MTSSTSSSLVKLSALRILRPLVRILLRNRLSCGEFIELAKQAYVDVAMEDGGIPGRKPSVSRAAVISGLTRKEVQRLVQQPVLLDRPVAEQHNRAARVVAAWVREPEYLEEGEPRRLAVDGEEPSFASLVRRHSGDMPYRAVLDELIHVGVARLGDDGRIGLLARSYVPQGDDSRGLHILGTDVTELVETIDHNLSHAGRSRRFQRTARYDNIPASALEAVRQHLAAECQRLLEIADGILAAHDRDINPGVPGDGRAVAGVGIYYFEQAEHDNRESEQ